MKSQTELLTDLFKEYDKQTRIALPPFLTNLTELAEFLTKKGVVVYPFALENKMVHLVIQNPYSKRWEVKSDRVAYLRYTINPFTSNGAMYCETERYAYAFGLKGIGDYAFEDYEKAKEEAERRNLKQLLGGKK